MLSDSPVYIHRARIYILEVAYTLCCPPAMSASPLIPGLIQHAERGCTKLPSNCMFIFF